MRKTLLLLTILVALARGAGAQEQEAKYIADTVTVQADAIYEADPDLATLIFQVSVTEKELRKAYDRATEALDRITQLAERNGLAKQDVTSGAFTVTPDIDWGDRKRKPKAYRVESNVTFRLRDFSRVGAVIDEAVEGGIAEFRSLTFSLADEEAAKVRAVTLARERAEARARAALGNGSKLGPPRIVTVDVTQPARVVSVTNLNGWSVAESRRGSFLGVAKQAAPPPPPPPTGSPEKISVRAMVHCVFQIAQTK